MTSILTLGSLALNLHLPDRSPAPTTRRAALGAALGVCVPAAAHAAFEVPLNKLEGGYKVRDYGNGVSSYGQPAANAAPAGVCTKSGPGCMPDGFGGFKPRDSDPTAPLYKRVGDAVFSDADGAPPPPPRAAAAARRRRRRALPPSFAARAAHATAHATARAAAHAHAAAGRARLPHAARSLSRAHRWLGRWSSRRRVRTRRGSRRG